MRSYEFEIAAKNAVLETLFADDPSVTIEDLELVWFAHEIGNNKCTIWGVPMERKYAEVTYSVINHQMYIDIYEKIEHREYNASKANTQATRRKDGR